MTQAQVGELTNAFAPGQFFDTWVQFAPFMIGIIGVLIAVGLIGWGVRKIRSRMSKGVA